jgi:hypothetical protein
MSFGDRKKKLGPVHLAAVMGRIVRIEPSDVGVEGSMDFRARAGA